MGGWAESRWGAPRVCVCDVWTYLKLTLHYARLLQDKRSAWGCSRGGHTCSDTPQGFLFFVFLQGSARCGNVPSAQKAKGRNGKAKPADQQLRENILSKESCTQQSMAKTAPLTASKHKQRKFTLTVTLLPTWIFGHFGSAYHLERRKKIKFICNWESIF